MKRRHFLTLLSSFTLAGCAGTDEELGSIQLAGGDECWITLRDSRAVAMYFDGTEGPFTGDITVNAVVSGQQLDLDFWHGHGGQLHRFSVTPEQLEAIKHGEHVEIQTTEVEGHSHTLYIDMMAEHTWVPGAPAVDVDLCPSEKPPREFHELPPGTDLFRPYVNA